MCTATNSAIPTAPVREEWHTRLTTPRRVSAGGSCGVRVVACAACQAAERPAPSTRGRTGSSTGTSCTATHSAIPTVPMREEWQTRLTIPLHVGAGGPRGSSRRVRRLPGGGAPCTQYQRSHGFHCASVGLLENPRRGGSGGHADSEQTQEPRVRRRRAPRPAPEAAPGPHCPYRSRRASHLSQRVGRARATSGASAHQGLDLEMSDFESADESGNEGGHDSKESSNAFAEVLANLGLALCPLQSDLV